MLNELVIPAVRDGGAFTSVRGFQGVPQRDIHFTATFVRSYAQEFEKLDRLRQQVEAANHASLGRGLSAGKGRRRHRWRRLVYERTAGHPILIWEDKPENRSARTARSAVLVEPVG